MSESIWKKEISLRRKPKPPREAAPAASEVAAPAPKQSIWKKEITLGRKRPKQDATPRPAVAMAPPLEPETDERSAPVPVREAPPPPELPHAAGDYEWRPEAVPHPPVVEPVPPPVPVNVVPLSAAPPAPDLPPAAAASEPEPEPEPEPKPEPERKPSFLKREIGRKKQPSAAEPAAEKAPKQPRPPRVPRRAKGNQLVGLKIGASQIAAARVANNGSAELLQVARAELPPGIVVGGDLRDPETLATVLKDFFTEHKLPKRDIRLGIANNRIGVRIFDVEGIDDPKQLANAIRFRAQETLPIPIEEAVLDYRVLSETVDAERGMTRRVLLVVAYRELIDRYVDACAKAGLRLVGVDLEAFALLRALVAPRDEGAPPDAAVVAVAIGYDRSTFAVSDGRVCEFTRVFEWGGSVLDVAIARALDIAPSEAEPLKRAVSLRNEDTPEGMSDDQAAKIRDAIRRQLQTFARELVSSLQFYQSQPNSLGIGSIVVTGGSAHLDGLADELQRLIGVPVVTGDPLARVRLGKKVSPDVPVGSLAAAIGLGIED